MAETRIADHLATKRDTEGGLWLDADEFPFRLYHADSETLDSIIDPPGLVEVRFFFRFKNGRATYLLEAHPIRGKVLRLMESEMYGGRFPEPTPSEGIPPSPDTGVTVEAVTSTAVDGPAPRLPGEQTRITQRTRTRRTAAAGRGDAGR